MKRSLTGGALLYRALLYRALAFCALLGVLCWAEPAAAQEEDRGGPEYPGYIAGGVVSLAGSAGFGIGSAFAAIDGSPKTALGLGALATIAGGVGVPLLLLGSADKTPISSKLVGVGTVVATAGTLGAGIGATILADRIASPEETELAFPLAMIIAGAGATVAGVVVYGFGAGHDDEHDHALLDSVRLDVGLGSVGLRGSF